MAHKDHITQEDFKMIVFRDTILILVLSILLASCATTKTPLPTDNIDELLGTWVNTEYDGGVHGSRYGKYVWKADGTASVYHKSTYDRAYMPDAKWSVKEKWMGGDGAIYYRCTLEHSGTKGPHPHYHLIRLSPDRSYHEMMILGDEEHPVEIDPNDPIYRIYYRQK